MGFLCKIKENKYLDNSLDRELGLSNIYDVNTETNFCFEPFNGLSYNLSGATKPVTGSTSPCSGTPTNCYAVYNLSEVDDVSLHFNFTGSTDYTGYTGQFCYRLYNRDSFTLNIPNKSLSTENPTYINCLEFSAITSSTITETISLIELPRVDTDYMLRSYYNFTPKECSVNNIDTWLSSTQLNNFNFNYDWYLITVTNPPTPQLTTTTDIITDNLRLKQQTILGANYQNNFNLEEFPINNEINLYINGVRMIESLDYTINSSSFPAVPPIIQIISGNIDSNDIITVVYLTGDQSLLTANGVNRNDFFEIDTFLVTGFTTNISASTVNIVNNNTVRGTQEVYLTNDFSDLSDVIVVINGITLTSDVEYYKSSSVKNKIIFNPNFTTIKNGDILSFWYFKTTLDNNADLGTLNTNSVDISWIVDELSDLDNNSGDFLVEVTETTDTTWTSLFYSENVEYTPNQEFYTVEVNNLTPNVDYKFRIIFYKTYNNILGEPIITSSELNGLFNTKNDEIIYRY